MPRRGEGAPAIARERPCLKCGADEWRKTKRGYRCKPCERRIQNSCKRAQAARDPASRLFYAARSRASEAGAEFAITMQDVRDVYPADDRCPVLGVVMRQGKGKVTDDSPTLDRMNSDWGYVRGNIAVISYAANRAKGAMRAEQLERIATWMRARGLA